MKLNSLQKKIKLSLKTSSLKLLVISIFFLPIAEIAFGSEVKKKDSYFYKEIGVQKFFEKDYQGAIDEFTKAININPKDAEAFNNRCYSKGIIGMYQEALDDCNKGISIDSEYGHAYDSRGEIKFVLNDFIGACSDYKTAIKYNVKEREAWLKSDEGSWCREINIQ